MPQEVDCSVDRGNHYLVYGGYTWRTLDGASPAGGCGGRCYQSHYDGGDWFMPVPAGWEITPPACISLREEGAALRLTTSVGGKRVREAFLPRRYQNSWEATVEAAQA